MPAARFSATFPKPAAVPATAPPGALSLGERLGVWRCAEALQSCESGRWYRAEHSLAPDQQAAVLVFQQPADAAAVLLRFADQVAVLSQLQHPGIATPLDSGLSAAGLPYVVLPWSEGEPLLSALQPLSLRLRLQVLADLCEALHYAHEQGLLLRELDPGLLWLSPGPRLRLMGLGLSELAPELDAANPEFSAAVRPFVAPELRIGAQPSLASEVFALGMLCCWVINGRPPRVDANGVLMPSAASLAALTAAERISLEALLHKAMADQPALRQPSARELGEDLRAWLAGQNHSALTLTPMPTPAPPTPSGSYFTPAFDGSATAPPPRRPWRTMLALSAVAVLGAAGWWATQQGLLPLG